MRTINQTLRLANNQFYPVEKEKTQIFLHHTAGTNAKGAISWWNQTPDHVGTAYVIDRDGTIYQAFDDDMWAFHLGITNDDNECEKHSVGIEIVSAGQLYKVGDKFMFYPIYPSLLAAVEIPKEEVAILENEWKGYKYYHKYTPEQIDSVIWLIGELSKKFNIPIEFPLGKFYEFDDSRFKEIMKGRPGVYSHSSVRKDKSDIYPSVELLKALESPNDYLNSQDSFKGKEDIKKKPKKENI